MLTFIVTTIWLGALMVAVYVIWLNGNG